METNQSCKNPECDDWPIYGAAPHECYWRKPGGFDNKLGTSTPELPEDWPDNFLLEVESPEKFNGPAWGLCGVYFCPKCKAGMADGVASGLWTKDMVISHLSKANASAA